MSNVASNPCSSLTTVFLRIISFFALCTTLSISFDAFSKDGHAIVGVGTQNLPPLMGARDTVLSDITQAAFAASQLQTRFDLYPKLRIKWALDNNKSQAVIGARAWFKNEPSSDIISVNIYKVTLHLFYLKEQFPTGLNFKQLSDLSDYRIGYVYGGALLPKLEEAGASIHLTKDSALNIKKLFRNRVDMVVVTKLSGWAAVKKDYPLEIDRFAIDQTVLSQVDIDVMFSPHNASLAETFAQGLSEIKRNGKYDAILGTYFPKD